ncbi:unnamed protein product, partial [Staurois parvus]
ERQAPGPPGGAAGTGPPGGAAGTGPPGGAAGTGPPGLRPPGGLGGHRVTRHNSGLRVNWDDRWHLGQTLDRLAGQRHRVTRHQVIWLDSGHRVIWQGSGLRVNRHDSEHRVIRYRIVCLDRGIGSPGHQVIWLASGTASLARQWAPGHQA